MENKTLSICSFWISILTSLSENLFESEIQILFEHLHNHRRMGTYSSPLDQLFRDIRTREWYFTFNKLWCNSLNFKMIGSRRFIVDIDLSFGCFLLLSKLLYNWIVWRSWNSESFSNESYSVIEVSSGFYDLLSGVV